MKTCIKCKKDLPASEFTVNDHREDGLSAKCKTCNKGRGKPSDHFTEDTATGCWIWNGAAKNNGYGNSYFKGKNQPAHRAVYMELVGDPGAFDLHHRCGNRACVNPAHLEPVKRKNHIAKTFRPRAYRISEQIDRYSIELIKNLYGVPNQKYIEALELDLTEDLGEIGMAVLRPILRGVIANSVISHCEWQVREGKHLSMEEVGLRAAEIRRINDLRIKAKNHLAELFGENQEHRAYFLPMFDSSSFTMDLRTVAESARRMLSEYGPTDTKGSAV